MALGIRTVSDETNRTRILAQSGTLVNHMLLPQLFTCIETRFGLQSTPMYTAHRISVTRNPDMLSLSSPLALPALCVALLTSFTFSGPAHAQKTPPTSPKTALTNAIGMELAAIPAGEFLMGSLDSDTKANADEKPQHLVKITTPFFIGVYEVTQEEYEKVMGANPSFFAKTGRGPEKVAGLDTRRFPVEFIRAELADAFCKKLSDLPEEKAAGRVYRLPTEAEWEYACRAGGSTSFHYGDSLSSLQANFNGNFPSPDAGKGPYIARPIPVGSYEPNEFGLYDMHGNVSEWCLDNYHDDFYKNSPTEDPLDEGSSGDRTVRGGSWGSDANNCRSRHRYNVLPVRRYQSRGFRVVMRVATESELQEVAEKKELASEKIELSEADIIFQAKVRPLLETYCTECHGGAAPAGDVALDQVDGAAHVATTGRTQWKRVWGQLVARAMPPPDENQPDEAEFDFLTAWIDTTLSSLDCGELTDPGHEPIRRLTRNEYKNTIRDLLGVDFEAADDFPADDIGATGDALSLPPILMESYLSAAGEIASIAIANDGRRIGDDDPRPRRVLVVRPDHQISREEAAHQVLSRLMSHAFRRPATDLELERILRLVVDRVFEQGGSFEEAMEVALQVTLVSPHFLFKVEIDPKKNDPKEVRLLNDYELATRTSYFLWSSMPDDQLLYAAARGTLRENLKQEVARMLKDPKALALVQDFGGHSWLQLPKLQSVTPDQQLFPEFDDELRQAMKTESELFLTALLREDRSIVDLIDADFTFVNERLARHYDLPIAASKAPPIPKAEFRRVSLAGSHLGGVITQASVMTLTANPDRTSPVKRGKWIMENILGTPPPAPPPGASEFAENGKSVTSGSLRERMETHRANPRCSVCHEEMDSLGFALENFDAIGRWRTHDGAITIDPSGTLPDGHSFQGPGQLKDLLSTHRKDGFTVCFIEKMLSYALGRELEYFDQCTVQTIKKALSEDGYKFSTLVTQIVESEPFQKRRARRRSDP